MLDSIENRIARHYERGDLEPAILAAAAAAGKQADALTAADLAPVDEYHTGGRQATADFAAEIGFPAGAHLLDVGCGIGGPARYFAETAGCRVTGIDLTAEYVETAAALSRRVGLGGRVEFRRASALDMPFEPAAFDGAYMMHVGMNIDDKARLFTEVRRVLKPGGLFAVFDMMRADAGDLAFPVPWAASQETSFVASPADYRKALDRARFDVVKERDRRDFAREFFRQTAAKIAAAGGPPPLGLHILMKGDAKAKVANVIANLERGLIAPIELVARAR